MVERTPSSIMKYLSIEKEREKKIERESVLKFKFEGISVVLFCCGKK